MASFTNRGLFLLSSFFFRGGAPPTNFYLALITSAVAPTVDTNTFSQLTEIAAGNGYTTGGIAVARDTVDWDTLTENDTNDRAELQMKDETWTASGGPIPSSGAGARYAILTTDEVTVGDRQVIFWWDLSTARSVSIGQPLTLQNCEIRLQLPVGVTNRGMKRMLDAYFRAQSVPTTLYTGLATDAVAPTVDTNTWSELTEIAIGNGYNAAGGVALARNSTDWDSLVENDTNDRAEVQAKDVVWTASGGNLPVSGSGARYATILDDNGTAGSRDVIMWFDLSAARTVSVGNSITIQNMQLDSSSV